MRNWPLPALLCFYSLVGPSALAESGSLIRVGEVWQYFKGTNEPTGAPLSWALPNYTTPVPWAASRSGFGAAFQTPPERGYSYELEPLIDHSSGYMSAYFRREFVIDDPSDIQWLTFRIDYQEGFAAYLNGTEVGRVNLPGAPGSFIPFDTAADARTNSYGVEFDLSAARHLLVPGVNVLAIQVHKDQLRLGFPARPRSGELLCVPELLANFNRGPFVQNIQTSAATVVFRNPVPTSGAVEYGITPELGQSLPFNSPGIQHEVRLRELLPGTTYFYRVRSSAGPVEVLSEISSFRTSANSGRVRFSVLGDSGSGALAQLQIADQMRQTPADLVLHCGDVIYFHFAPGQTDTRCLSVYGEHMRQVPYYFTVGNHDLYDFGGVSFLDAFSLPTNGLELNFQWASDRTVPEFYYSFDQGDVHFVCLYNPGYKIHEFSTNSLQYRWLEADLAASTKPWKVLFQHIPTRSSAPHRFDLMTIDEPTVYDWQRLQATLLPVAARYGVSLILNGHEHCYERFAPVLGVHSVTSGGGGASLYALAELDELSSLFSSIYHFLNIEVDGSQMTIRAIGTRGQLIDEWKILREPPARREYLATWSVPVVESLPADDGDGNITGQRWDSRWELMSAPEQVIEATTGKFSNLGRLRVAYDSTNVYFGFDRVMLPPHADLVAFIEVPGIEGVTNLSGLGNGVLDPSGQGVDALDGLSQLSFADFRPSIAMVLGDEFADGTDRAFRRPGALHGGGQGVFRLAPGFPSVPGVRLQQFNQAIQNSVWPGEQNADFIAVAIPRSELSGVGTGQTLRLAAIAAGGLSAGNPPARAIDDGLFGAFMDGGSKDAPSLGAISIRLPEDTDGDHDGLSRTEELRFGTNPERGDTDGDGLLDGWELVNRLNPQSSAGDQGMDGDPDRDGLTNLDEQKLGTNPLKKDFLRLAATQAGDGRIILRWPSLSRTTVIVESATGQGGGFVQLAVRPPDTQNTSEELAVQPSESASWFRLRLQK